MVINGAPHFSMKTSKILLVLHVEVAFFRLTKSQKKVRAMSHRSITPCQDFSVISCGGIRCFVLVPDHCQALHQVQKLHTTMASSRRAEAFSVLLDATHSYLQRDYRPIYFPRQGGCAPNKSNVHTRGCGGGGGPDKGMRHCLLSCEKRLKEWSH